MSVWFAIVASMSFMYLTSPDYEWSTAVRVVLAIVYVCTFFGGMRYDDRRNDRIKKLEKAVEELKKK